jgi:hypothetical protein
LKWFSLPLRAFALNPYNLEKFPVAVVSGVGQSGGVLFEESEIPNQFS